MKSVCSFCVKFASLISGPLRASTGHLQGASAINRAEELHRFVDYVLKQRRCDFMRRPWTLGPSGWYSMPRITRTSTVEPISIFRATLTRTPGQDPARPAWRQARSHRHLVRSGNLPNFQARLCRQTSHFCTTQGAAARPLLLLPRSRPRSDACPFADLGPFHCQIYVNGHASWPQVWLRKYRLRADRQLLHATERPTLPSVWPTVSSSCPGRKSWKNTPARSIRSWPRNSRNWVAITGSAIRPSSPRILFCQQARLAGLFTGCWPSLC